jgi:hypothetical protein
MGLQERVEQLLSGSDKLRRASVVGDLSFGCYYVDEQADGSVRVRGGVSLATFWPSDPSTTSLNNSTLNECYEILVNDGLRVEHGPDQTGGHLVVREP